MKTVLIVGPKPNKMRGYSKTDAYSTAVKQLKEMLTPIIESNKQIRFITDGSQGFAHLAFWAVNNLKKQYENNPDIVIKNCIHTAYFNIARKWIYTGVFGAANFRKMRKLADTFDENIETEQTNTRQLTDELYNHLTDECDICICATNNKYWLLPNQSATDNALRMASLKHKTLGVINYSVSGSKLILKEPVYYS